MIALVLVYTAFVVAVAIVLTVPFQLVTRQRVERFAWRQHLRITVDNGQDVIAYLATTRRWRGCGIIATVAGTVLAYGLRLVPTGHFNAFTLVVGWFFGAVVAEWRVAARAARTTRRSASLTPRLESDYLTARVRWSTRLALAVTLGTEIVAVARGSNSGEALVLLVVTVPATVSLWLVSRRILSRPQPETALDVLAADEAIRSRSLHVLSGSAIALSSWFGYLAATLVLHTRHADQALVLASTIILIVGARVAVHTSMPPRRLAAIFGRGAVV